MAPDQILDYCQDALLIIGSDRKVLWSNVTAQRVLSCRATLSLRDGRLTLGSSAAEHRFDELLVALETRAARGQRIVRVGTVHDWLLLLRRLPSSTPSEGQTFLLHVVGRTRPRAIPLQALRDLYALSARETEIAADLLRDCSLTLSAKRLHISRETARTHLARIFRKCDVHSQEELLGLLRCCALFGA